MYLASSPSSHTTVPFVNAPMMPPTFTPTYNEYNNPSGLHYPSMGVLLQPLMAGPMASTPDGPIPGPPPGTINVLVAAGNVFRLQFGDEIREIMGPATVRMVSSNDGSQLIPIQLTEPSPGQIVQQIVDENGILTHLILSSQPQQHSSQMPYNPNDIDPKQMTSSVTNVQQPPVNHVLDFFRALTKIFVEKILRTALHN